MHLLLLSASAQVYKGFAVYAVRGEGFSGKVDNLVMYRIVTWNGETSDAAAERVTHQKYLYTTVIFLLEVRGVTL